ncbi:glycosyl transferase group 1 [Stanieria cyanosphaera PCC 7437]|uniref:Glycosyl transferase group 1 n=1 Tax=Stanieria cyanosphaera (strain ATCC 29371 / PCC 7437) TaxID=111780 RepID=K9XS30_STAC7|nr:glycosyltransferase family 4 protein [Stanieria cyanosphaera]AFZ34477.1 glycosyl transferase group 1 [Stanieria cyanosphaera PCC 7437]
MRIAYICADPGVPVFGQKGCSIHVQEILRSLLKLGHQVTLFAIRLGDHPPEDLAQIPVYRLPPIPKGEQSMREKVALAVNPDLQLELELAGSFDLIYERYSLWSFSGMEYARAKGIPGILEVNAPLIEEQAKHRGLIYCKSAEGVAQRVFTAASKIVAVSAPIKNYLTNYVSPEKIHVIPNGVNCERFASPLLPTFPTNSETFVVGFVGSLKPWHGLSILTDAFTRLHQRVSQSRLLIVGDGPEREKIEADLLARNLQSAVHFTGAVTPNQIPGLLASMNVAVAPYPERTDQRSRLRPGVRLQVGRDFYFSPLKVYEYMAAGLPVVTSSIGQLTDLIEDGINGILCPPGDAEALANALELLWRSPELAMSLGNLARHTVLQNHTWDAIAHEILTLANVNQLVGGFR